MLFRKKNKPSDENLTEEKTEKVNKERRQINPGIIRIGKVAVAVLFTLLLGMMLLTRILSDTDSAALKRVTQIPETELAKAVTPIQGAFANATDMVVSYLRKLKYRSNLELEYNKLKAEYDQLVYQAMLASQMQRQLAVYQDMVGEMSLNESMQPIMATVIGQDEGNYTATFTINKGTRDGIADFMAVTVGGAMVGYTFDTTETKSQVKALIDSDASIPSLIESTRDQGNIRGTLGVDGKHMCRMYHVDSYIPRPGDRVVTSGFSMPFPKGIPIGIVRESTRGMDANKQYIVVEPLVDFTHLEYVIVYRYQPTPGIMQNAYTESEMDLIPLPSARPIPTMNPGIASILGGATPGPNDAAIISPNPSDAAPTNTIAFEPIDISTPNAGNGGEITYNDPNASPTPPPEPTPTPTATPTQAVTVDDLTLEDDN